MCFMKLKRRSNSDRRKYYVQVQEYLKVHSFSLIQKIQRAKGEDNICYSELFVGNYPKAPWVFKNDQKRQFVCFFQQIGVDFFHNDDGCLAFDINQLSEAIIQNHLKLNREDIMDRLAVACKKTHGRISYRVMQNVLGFEDYQVAYSDARLVRECVLLFTEKMQLLYKYDKTHIYLP